MKKIIFGALFVAIIASSALAIMYLCYGTASGFNAGWTITPTLQGGSQVPNTYVGTTNDSGYFSCVRILTTPTGTEYYLKATKSGQTTKYSGWYVFGGDVDSLGTISIARTTPPPPQ